MVTAVLLLMGGSRPRAMASVSMKVCGSEGREVREGKGREGKGREGKGREGKGREGQVRSGQGRAGQGRRGQGRPVSKGPCTA